MPDNFDPFSTVLSTGATNGLALSDEDLAKMFSDNSPATVNTQKALAENVKMPAPAPTNNDNLATAAATAPTAKNSALPVKMDTTNQDSVNTSIANMLQQGGNTSNFGVTGDSFGDIIKAFKPSQGGGFGAGIAKIGEYLNSPEGIEMIGGLISKQNPYAGLSMVNKGEQMRQALMQRNMPLAPADKAKLLAELSKNNVDIQKFMTDYGLRAQDIENQKAKTASEITKNQADIANQQAERQQSAQNLAEKEYEDDLNARGIVGKTLAPTPKRPISGQTSSNVSWRVVQ